MCIFESYIHTYKYVSRLAHDDLERMLIAVNLIDLMRYMHDTNISKCKMMDV